MFEARLGSPKPPAPYSPLVGRVRLAHDDAGLQEALKGRQYSSEEQDEAVAALLRHRLAGSLANRSLVLTFAWAACGKTPDIQVASHAVLEWLHRMGRHIHGHKYPRLQTSELFSFAAIPEVWDRHGNPVPLHYHVMMAVPEDRLPWFDKDLKGAEALWQKTAFKVSNIYASAYRQDVSEIHGLARYDAKHLNTNWGFLHSLFPPDLGRYRTERCAS